MLDHVSLPMMLDGNNPVSWLHYDNNQAFSSSPISSPSIVPQQSQSQHQQPFRFRDRDLESNDGDYDSYLVDEDGNSYEPYSLAWRYLGMYIDCQEDDNDKDGGGDNSQDQRRRMSQDSKDGSCSRKVLWAAYHDPDYSGGTIGEYQFYNQTTGTYDDSFCRSDRCVPLDCHEPDTHFQLVGVFKETDGLEDFAEQLFKHQGYCLWQTEDEDTTIYDLMSTYREYLPAYCKQLYYPDDNDDTLFMDIRPQAEGNIGLGVYTDDLCTQLSKRTKIEDYIKMFYEIKGNSQKGKQVARAWTKAVKKWNENMNVYKSCQPCRAYTLHANEEEDDSRSGDSGDGRRQRQRQRRQLEHITRMLGDDNDGEGDEEQWGYDCYDDAGYTNCNQCYKFETKTDMEKAEEADLIKASRQGSILEVHVNGKRYGKGIVGHHPILPPWAMTVLLSLSGSIVLVGISIYLFRRFRSSALLGTILQWIRERFTRKDLPSSFKEHFHIEGGKDDDDDDNATTNTTPLSYVYE